MSGKLLAIDPSLTCSGWALFEIDSGSPILFDIIKPPGTDRALTARYEWLQEVVSELFRRLALGSEDYLICEGPAPLVKNPESALRVERVRGVFEAVGRMNRLSVISRLNPRSVQSELLGLRGPQIKRAEVKEIARAACERLFPTHVKDRTLSQDVIDALLIGALTVSRLQMHQRTGVDLETLFQPKQSARGRARGRDGFGGWRVSNS